jgi:hypothetical protein
LPDCWEWELLPEVLFEEEMTWKGAKRIGGTKPDMLFVKAVLLYDREGGGRGCCLVVRGVAEEWW